MSQYDRPLRTGAPVHSVKLLKMSSLSLSEHWPPSTFACKCYIHHIFIDREAGEVMRLVVSVCLFVCMYHILSNFTLRSGADWAIIGTRLCSRSRESERERERARERFISNPDFDLHSTDVTVE